MRLLVGFTVHKEEKERDRSGERECLRSTLSSTGRTISPCLSISSCLLGLIGSWFRPIFYLDKELKPNFLV